MAEYKVIWETLKGVNVSDWMTKPEAEKKFDKLKNEKVLKTVWAELIFSSLDENATDEELVVDSFTRKVVEIMGKKMIV